jgi:hypothetical protein
VSRVSKNSEIPLFVVSIRKKASFLRRSGDDGSRFPINA